MTAYHNLSAMNEYKKKSSQMLYYVSIVPCSTNQTKLIQTNILMQNQRFLTQSVIKNIHVELLYWIILKIVAESDP